MNDLDVLRAFGADLDTVDAPETVGAPPHVRHRIVTGIADDGHGHPTAVQAAQRLDRRWRQAADVPPAGRTARRTIRGYGRQLHLVAVAIAALVVIAGGALLSNIVSQRGSADPGDTPGVEGSFRATVDFGDGQLVTYHFVDGRVYMRFDDPLQFDAPAAWRGFGGAEPVVADQQIISDGVVYLHARTSAQERFRWYRYSGTQLGADPELTDTELPVFTDGTRGFRQVDDAEATAQGLTHYSANVANTAKADLDSLGWFSPWARNMNYEESGPNAASLDLWIDAGGRVHRKEQVVVGEPEFPERTRFDRFDALRPIDLPSSEVPVATDGLGLTLTAAGDLALAEELRERVRAVLDGDERVASYKLLDKPTAEQDRIDDTRQWPHDERIFIVAVRLVDDRGRDALMDRVSNLSVVSGGRSADFNSVQTAHWMELGG